MTKTLVVTGIGWLMAVAFFITGLGLFVFRVTGQSHTPWWWLALCGVGFVVSLAVMTVPMLLKWVRE
jgi:hypothetical protein